jgi:hypothetical protein
MRSWTSIAVAGTAVAAGAALGMYLLERQRRRPLAALPAPTSAADDPATDEPISRETRYDEEIDAEERRRHEAAERLRADPLNERLNGDEDNS